jgi:hypothetical protein
MKKQEKEKEKEEETRTAPKLLRDSRSGPYHASRSTLRRCKGMLHHDHLSMSPPRFSALTGNGEDGDSRGEERKRVL